MLLGLAQKARRLLVGLSLAPVVTFGPPPSNAGGVGLSLANDGLTTARLICNDSVVLDQVYYLRLVLSDGSLLISYRESLLSGAPEKVLILTAYAYCEAQETKFPSGSFNSD